MVYGVYWLIAGVIVLLLALYAGRLLWQLRQQTIAEKAQKQKLQAKQLQRDIDVLNSVILIAKAMNQQQCDISEGCWRLSVLIESMESHADRFIEKFPAIFNLYNDIKHMPILDKRKALSKKERLKLDLERMGIEEKLEPEVNRNVEGLEPYAIELKVELQARLSQN
ncbi:DUF2489 domain-containing protein [Thalassotalea aquiviva]|uniref:DUF2489 domain-containing protein n=1 Tax=Thalassotalea aquiviva TaxID=3242415 RepID=UPI00352B5E8C